MPFDCFEVIPLKKPINECLVLAVYALIYLNQSFSPYGVSLNSIANHSTSFPLKSQDGVKMSCDCAQVEFMDNDKLVLSLNNGELLYVLTLCADSMRSFHFSKGHRFKIAVFVCIFLLNWGIVVRFPCYFFVWTIKSSLKVSTDTKKKHLKIRFVKKCT